MQTSFIIGRTLDVNGQPINGTGLTLEKDGPTCRLLFSQKNIVLFTNPITREFGAVVKINENGKVATKGLGIVPPGAAGPPSHVHPSYEEAFEVLEGRFVFVMNKKEMKVESGDKIVVPPGVAHTFRPYGDTVASFLVEARPAGRLNEVVHTIFGLAHDNKLDKKGRPNFWQGIAIGSELSNDTYFTNPPVGIQRILFRLFGKAAATRGYKAIYPEYMEDDFWKKRVEQIDFSLKESNSPQRAIAE